MKLEQQVCSLEFAKRLKELGVKQESYFWWAMASVNGQPDYFLVNEKYALPTAAAAFTVAELGKMMMSEDTVSGYSHERIGWFCESSQHMKFNITEDTEADARAKMLVYLIENGLMKPEGMAA
jgi:hypothetical protein